MNTWIYLEYGAWGLSAIVLLWIAIDSIRTGVKYSEDFLMSAREGEVEIVDETVEGGHHHGEH